MIRCQHDIFHLLTWISSRDVAEICQKAVVRNMATLPSLTEGFYASRVHPRLPDKSFSPSIVVQSSQNILIVVHISMEISFSS